MQGIELARLFEWVAYNVLLSMLSIPLVILATWLGNNRKNLFDVIRDGQLCFYCTTTLATFLNDASSKNALDRGILAACLVLFILSTFVYGVATIYTGGAAIAAGPAAGAAAAELQAKKVGWTSLLCATATTILVVGVRAYKGLL